MSATLTQEALTETKETNFQDLWDALRGAESVALFAHASPDPDALGALLGMEWVLAKIGVESTIYIDGEINHPQNAALNNLLGGGFSTAAEYKPAAKAVVVDAIPKNAGVGNNKGIKFDAVIDHHATPPNGGFAGVYINLHNGSACGAVFEIIKESGFGFSENSENDQRVATAMLVGIITDTENLMSEDATDIDMRAFEQLIKVSDREALKKIVHWEIPMEWAACQADAISRLQIENNVGIVALKWKEHYIPVKHRAVIPHVADYLVSLSGINTAVVFGIVGCDLVGCVRSNNPSLSVSKLCQELGEKAGGNGGGKLTKGAYKLSLGSYAIDADEDDEETRESVWSVLTKKEFKRVRKIINR